MVRRCGIAATGEANALSEDLVRLEDVTNT